MNASHPISRPRPLAGALPWLSALALATALLATPAAAQRTGTPVDQSAYTEITRLIGLRQYKAALDKAEAGIAANPRDPQMRFLKAAALSESGQVKAAIEVLETLTQDYPELAEPYNNLAVLYAQQNEYDRARAALEQAVRNNPAYATAHENLGDIYLRMASQSYARTAELDKANPRVGPKQVMLRQVLNVGVKAPAQAAARKPGAKAAPAKPAATGAKSRAAAKPAAPAASAPAAGASAAAPAPSAPSAPSTPAAPASAAAGGW